MKKFLSVILSVIILLGLFSVAVFADIAKPSTFQDRVLNAIRDMETVIDLSEYKVSTEDAMKYLSFVHQQYPEYYYINGISGGKMDNEGIIKTLELAYTITKEQMLEERAFMEAETDKVINRIGKEWSEAEKALYVHDWLDVNFMYDYDLFEAPGTENHDIVGFLRDKRGVCQSYAYTFMYVMHRLGINAYYVVSETDNHGWNVVQIDGNWYHVDVTYDDPILGYDYHYDYVGEVRHNKFLLSDDEIIADGSHDDFYIPEVEGIVCGEYKGNDSWRTATTAVHKIDEYWYYLDNYVGGLVRTKDFETTEQIMEIGYYVDNWGFYGWKNGNKIQDNYFAGLFEYNEHLFFNTEEKIYVYDSHHNVFKELPIDKPEGKIYYGLNMDGKTVTYLASGEDLKSGVVEGSYTLGIDIHHKSTDWEIIKEPTETEDGLKVKFCYYCADIVEHQTIPATGGEAEVVLGDANGDGFVDTTDLAALKLYLAGLGKWVSEGTDINSDLLIDTVDLANLKLKLAGL